MDRGYNDYKLFAYWTSNGIFFVTMLKENADYSVIKNLKLPKNRNILADQLICFNGQNAKKTVLIPFAEWWFGIKKNNEKLCY